jgi:hypothetical protein
MTKAEQGRLSGTYSSIWPARRQARRGGFLFLTTLIIDIYQRCLCSHPLPITQS